MGVHASYLRDAPWRAWGAGKCHSAGATPRDLETPMRRCPNSPAEPVVSLCGRRCGRWAATASPPRSIGWPLARGIADGLAEVPGVEVLNDVLYTQVCLSVRGPPGARRPPHRLGESTILFERDLRPPPQDHPGDLPRSANTPRCGRFSSRQAPRRNEGSFADRSRRPTLVRTHTERIRA